MWRPGRSRRFAAARARSSSAGVYPRNRALGGTLDSTTGNLGRTGRLDGVFGWDRSRNDLFGRRDRPRRPHRDLPAGRAGGDDPVDRRPARGRRGPRRRRGRAALAQRTDPDRAGIQAPARRPDPDHPGWHAVRRRVAPRPPAEGDRGQGQRAVRRPARRHRPDPPRELRRLQDRPPRAGHPPGRCRERDPADRARGGRRPLRPAGARAGRRGHRRVRLRRRDVRRHDPAQDRGRLRAARATRGDGAPGRDRLRRGALHQRDGPGPSGRRHGRPERPGCPGRHRPTARGMPAGQGGPLVRYRHDDPGRAARPPDRDAPDPRGIRGDDPAADHRDDRGARAGGQECEPRLRRGRSHPPGRRVVAHPARRGDGPRVDRPPDRGRCASEALDGAGGGIRRRAASTRCAGGQ